MTTMNPESALPRISTPSGTKWTQIGIWVSTGLFATIFALSGAMFLTGPQEVVASFRHLGYPDYFRDLLGMAKLLGVAALVVALPSPTPREWAYAGFTFTCIAAAASHLMSGDPAGKVVGPVLMLALLMTSYLLRRRAALTNTTST